MTLSKFTCHFKFWFVCWVVYNRYHSVPFFSLLEGHGELFSFNLRST